VGVSLKPTQLKRYHDILGLLAKYGRSDALRSATFDSMGHESPGAGPVPAGEAEEFTADLEKRGPTFIKLGQLLSTRADLFPVEYLDALARLQDRVEPFDPEDARARVEEELGVRVSKAFGRFDEEPLASASLAQVHYAELRDGKPVVVKVQRPGVREEVKEDLKALREVARLLDERTDLGDRYDFTGIVSEFEVSLAEELDYLQEAKNLKNLKKNLSDFDLLVVPEAIEDFTTSRVLTMEFVSGRKITAVSPLRRIEVDGAPLARQLFEAYLQQILVDGLFHADPHPGNLFLTDDDRIALLDLGMVGRIPSTMRESLLRLLLAISSGDGERAGRIAAKIGEPRENFDKRGFLAATAKLVSRYQDTTAEDIEMGRVVLAVTQNASDYGIRVPSTLTLLGKTLLNLDQIGRLLDPHFDPNAAVQRNAADILQSRLFAEATPGNIGRTALEMNEFVQELPGRLNDTLDRIAQNEVEFTVRAFDEVHLMEGLQKIANRITLGLVLAALIVGAALLVQVDTEFTILGYPGLAIALFLAAAGGGAVLMVNIAMTDEKVEHPRKDGSKRR
jgi:ubiquinone biosynthesis protein